MGKTDIQITETDIKGLFIVFSNYNRMSEPVIFITKGDGYSG